LSKEHIFHISTIIGIILYLKRIYIRICSISLII